MLNTIFSVYQELDARLNDSLLNIETRHLRERDGVEYIPLNFSYIRQALNYLRPTRDDVVYDLGCGMGRITCVAAQEKVKGVVGIDFDEKLTVRAQENANRMRGKRAPISIVCADCTQADMSSGTIFFAFNPFPAPVLAGVLENIQRSLPRNPRKVRFVYIFPTLEEVFAQSGWLRKTATLGKPFRGTKMQIWEGGK